MKRIVIKYRALMINHKDNHDFVLLEDWRKLKKTVELGCNCKKENKNCKQIVGV